MIINSSQLIHNMRTQMIYPHALNRSPKAMHSPFLKLLCRPLHPFILSPFQGTA
jgi:hypothetical protein